MSVQWKRENAGESAENTQVSVSRMLRSHEDSKPILMGSQVEMRDFLLKLGKVVIFVIKHHRAWMNHVHVLVFCGLNREGHS